MWFHLVCAMWKNSHVAGLKWVQKVKCTCYFFSLEESKTKRHCRWIFNALMIGAHISPWADTAVTLWRKTTSWQTTSRLHWDTASECIDPSEEDLNFSVWIMTMWANGFCVRAVLWMNERWIDVLSTEWAEAADQNDSTNGPQREISALCTACIAAFT